jgi:adenylate cyclase
MARKLLQGLLVGLGAATLALLLWSWGRLDDWEARTWDWRARAFARPAATTPRVKLILLDQASLDYGKTHMGWSWPWPRVAYTPILEFCRMGGARAIAFDVIYTEPSRDGVADDEAFGEGLAQAPQLISALTLSREAGEHTGWPPESPPPGLEVAGLSEWLAAARADEVAVGHATFPVPELSAHMAMLGHVLGGQDRDSVIRRAALFHLFDGQVVPFLGLGAYLVGERAAGRPVDLAVAPGAFRMGDVRIPIDDQARAILNYRVPPHAFDRIRAAAVIESFLRLQEGLEPEIRPELFKDCYVLFGFSAPALLDLRPTPVNPAAPGVEVHATALDNLLAGDFIRPAPVRGVLLATLLLAVLSGVTVTLSRNARQSVLAFVVLLPLPVLLGVWSHGQHTWWPMVVTELGVVLALVGAVVVNYATEGRQKAFIKSAFRQYLGAEVIEDIIRDPSRLRLGGEKKELTMFFSDLEKFSSFSERLDPPRLIELLNVYLSEVGRIIMAEGGYVDKYIGDAIVAFWNAPVSQPDHAARAVRAALLCQRRLDQKRDEWAAQFDAVLKMRIGVNTGEVVVGNMGSQERFNYTMLGDAANLASRLEGAGKAFGLYMLVAESTWRQVSDAVQGREIGAVRVVGRKTPVRVYEALALAGEPVPDWLPIFEQGLAHCRERRWTDALAFFERIADDRPAAMYAEKCRAAVAGAAADWDGVWNLTEK